MSCLSANPHHSPPTTSRGRPETASTPQRSPLNTEALGFLQRPWQRVKKLDEPETAFVMARRNYTIFANIGLSRRATWKFATILDTGSGPSLIKKYVFHESLWKNLQPSGSSVTIRDSNTRSVNVDGTIDLVVNIGRSVKTVSSNVVERIATQIILGCHYYDKHIESIRHRQKIAELADGTIVPNRYENASEMQTFDPLAKKSGIWTGLPPQ